jgi:hypothetical protein
MYGEAIMKKKRQNIVKNRWIENRQSIVIVTCILLLTTTSSAVFLSTSNHIPSTTFIEKNTQTHISERLSYTFSFQEPHIEEITLFDSIFSMATVPGCTVLGQRDGLPALPVKFIKLLLPPQTTVHAIHVDSSLVEVEVNEIDLLQKPIVPYQNPVPISTTPSEKIKVNDDFYCSDDLYPSKCYGQSSIGHCRGYSILSFALHPIKYSPGTGKVFYYPEMTIQVDLEKTEEDMHRFFRNNPEDEDWVKGLVFNSEMTERYDTFFFGGYPGGLCDPDDHYDYVIITTTYNGLDYWENSWYLPYNWESLMQKHAIDDDLSCTLITIQDIDDCADYYTADPLFNDTMAHIREFCRDAYQDWGTSYILIGGDDEWIPARHMDYAYEHDVDADIYWSNLDKTFNDDHDNLWGEEEDSGFDLYAELFIGRIPCDEPIDVSNWLTKSFYYTDNVDVDYLENAAFFGGDMGWNSEGDDFIDYAAIKGTSDWLGPNPGSHGYYPSWLGFQYGFETWNALHPDMPYNLSVKWSAEDPNPGWMGGNITAALTGMKNAINNDHVTLLCSIAHADPFMVMSVDCDSWEQDYRNTKPFFIADMGCHCGDMDDADDGVLHSMLFHSDTELAFACMFNTGYGWGSQDDTNSSSCLQMKLFWDYLFDTMNNSIDPAHWQMGRAMAWSKDAMAPTINWTHTGAPGSWRAIIQGCLLFGDPAQRIKPPKIPNHNIGVSDLEVPRHVLSNNLVPIETTIVNNGDNDEINVHVHVLVNDVEQETVVLPILERQTSVELPFSWTPGENGVYDVTINVTIPGVIEEFLHDNEQTKQVVVGPDVAILTLIAPKYAATDYLYPIKGTIANPGLSNEEIEISFIVDDSVEDTKSLYLSSGTQENVTFEWTPSKQGTYPIGISVEITGSEPFTDNNQLFNVVTVYVPQGSILLVDDDKDDSYEQYYESALQHCNYFYELWDRTTQGSPSADIMQDYDAVIWLTGYEFIQTIDDEDQENLIEFLDNNGSLFVSGAHIGYDIGGTSFFNNYLHADYLVADTNSYTLVGVPDDPIGHNLILSIEDGDGANNQDWANGIAPLVPATTVFEFQDSDYNGGIKCVTFTHRVVYFSFGFEAINTMKDRIEVMSRVLDWLLLDIPRPMLSINISGGLEVKAVITNSGTLDMENVNITLQVTGGILHFIDETMTEAVNLSVGESKMIATDLLFGIGRIDIIARADDTEQTAKGVQIAVFSFVKQNSLFSLFENQTNLQNNDDI